VVVLQCKKVATFVRQVWTVRELCGSLPQCLCQPLDVLSVLHACRVLSMLQECRPVELYHRIRAISEGTYGWVYQAHVMGHPDKVVALKKVHSRAASPGLSSKIPGMLSQTVIPLHVCCYSLVAGADSLRQ